MSGRPAWKVVSKQAACGIPRKCSLRESDDRQGRRDVQRREARRSFQLAQDRIVDPAMLAKAWSTMHEAMADGGRRVQVAFIQETPDALDRLVLVGEGGGSRTRVRRADRRPGTARRPRVRFAGEQHLGAPRPTP